MLSTRCGRLVSIARGEQDFFSQDGVATATEGCKSNALMRCCKDLGIASELWSVLVSFASLSWAYKARLDDRDPRFIAEYKRKYCVGVWAKHVTTGQSYVQVFLSTLRSAEDRATYRKTIWRRKDVSVSIRITE